MEIVPARLLTTLEERAYKVGERLQRPVRLRQDPGASGGPCVWLEAQDNLGDFVPLVVLALPQHVQGYRYTVSAVQAGAPTDRFTYDTDAVRNVQTKALKAWQTLSRRKGPDGARFAHPGAMEITASHKVSQSHANRAAAPTAAHVMPALTWGPSSLSWSTTPAAPRQAPSSGGTAPVAPLNAPCPATAPVAAPAPPTGPMQSFTGDQAVAHPVIRAAIIASYEAAKITGQTVDPVTVLTMADAGTDVVAIGRPGSTTDPARTAEVERVLVGLLLAALTAAVG